MTASADSASDAKPRQSKARKRSAKAKAAVEAPDAAARRRAREQRRAERDAKASEKAAALELLSDPLAGTVKEIAREAGLSENQVGVLVGRLRRKGLMLKRALGQVTKQETQQLYEHTAFEILKSITPGDIAGAGLRDKLIAAGVATDKGLLLSGQPTEILSIPQLANLDQLAGLLVEEAGRRGHGPVVDESTGVVTLQPVTRTGYGPTKDPTSRFVAPTDEPG